jgi:cytochrome c oxidase subunit 3
MAHDEVHHDYHLVDPSPWPIVGSVAAFLMLIGTVFWMHEGYNFFGLGLGGTPWVMIVGFVLVLYTMAGWWRDVVKESVVQGHHKPVVKLGFRYGMILFIASEVMFFFAWFWAYFNSAIFPGDVAIGAWPPEGIVTFDPWHLPFLNTLILLTSGTTVTWAHHAILMGHKRDAVRGLALTVALGVSFTCVQAYEYSHAAFTFGMNGLDLVPLAGMGPEHSDLGVGIGNLSAIYGSTFFMATGFHGLHVIIGSIFLIVCLFRAMAGHFTPTRHFGFEAAAWYWHFVDVVWLFLFACIYVWGAGDAVAVAAGH